jgi:hypothetical protein
MDTLALTRQAAPRKLRITLTAGRAAAKTARSEVRAAIQAWNVPVDPTVAALLTTELVTNALRHEAGRTIELVVSCAYRQLQVDVYDTSPAPAPGVEMMLLSSMSTGWGYYRTPTGTAGYFTLMY